MQQVTFGLKKKKSLLDTEYLIAHTLGLPHRSTLPASETPLTEPGTEQSLLFTHSTRVHTPTVAATRRARGGAARLVRKAAAPSPLRGASAQLVLARAHKLSPFKVNKKSPAKCTLEIRSGSSLSKGRRQGGRLRNSQAEVTTVHAKRTRGCGERPSRNNQSEKD